MKVCYSDGSVYEGCSPCTTCSDTEYETTACSETADRICNEKPICQDAFDYAQCAAMGMINHYMSYPGEACEGHTCELHECCREMPTPDRWTCWYHGDDGDGWRNAGDTASGGTKFCPAGTHARTYHDHHCMGGWCGDFPESECCVRTCWETGWRDPGEVSSELGSGESGSGGAHGTYQCPAGQIARPWYDMHDCGDRYAAVGLAHRVLQALPPRAFALFCRLASSLPIA